jgi:hypothetical protein
MNRSIRAASAAAMLMLVSSVALASSVKVVDATYTVSSFGAMSISEFDLTGPSQVTVSLQDIPWPAPLQGVKFELLSDTGKDLGSFSGFGTQTFDVKDAGTVYALSFGIAAPQSASSLGFGTYGLTVAFAPTAAVPLPAGTWLFASALGLFGVLRRKSSPYQGVVQSECKTTVLGSQSALRLSAV